MTQVRIISTQEVVDVIRYKSSPNCSLSVVVNNGGEIQSYLLSEVELVH